MRHAAVALATVLSSGVFFAGVATAQISSAPSSAGGGIGGPTSPGLATPGSTLPPLTAPTSVTPNAGAPGAAGRTDPTNPNNPNDSLRSGLNRTANGVSDTTNALGSPTAERADESWCRTAGLSASDMRGCVSRMSTAGTDQQRADIQSTYRGRSGAMGASQSSGGSASLNTHLDSGLGVGAASTRNAAGGNPQ